MYYLNIADDDVTPLHETIKVNKTYTIDQCITATEFFDVEQHSDNIYKITPMFYCEEIISSNDDDAIFDNKCIIAEYNPDTVYDFISEHTIKEIIAMHNSSTHHILNFYDKATLKPIEDIEIKTTTTTFTAVNTLNNEMKTLTPTYDSLQNQGLTPTDTDYTDEEGMIILPLTITAIEVSYQFLTTTIQLGGE